MTDKEKRDQVFEDFCKTKDYPCGHCEKRKTPSECGDKNCVDFRKWFIRHFGYINHLYKKYRERGI